MKAAVLYGKGGAPRYVDFPEPVPQNDGEVLVSVKAVALKHFDESRAGGTHYSVEGDGQDAKVTMALRFRAGIEPGDTVLINGATGFTGRIAVQIARHYGAGKIIATGRNSQSLQELLALGADEFISIQQTDGELIAALRQLHRITPINVVIDYLWGHVAEMILAAIKGDGLVSGRTRFVSVGAMTGDLIQLSAANLRGTDLVLSGSGLGSWTRGQIGLLFSEILPEMFQLAADGKLKVGTTPVRLRDIEKLWEVDVPDGGRLVVRI